MSKFPKPGVVGSIPTGGIKYKPRKTNKIKVFGAFLFLVFSNTKSPQVYCNHSKTGQRPDTKPDTYRNLTVFSLIKLAPCYAGVVLNRTLFDTTSFFRFLKFKLLYSQLCRGFFYFPQNIGTPKMNEPRKNPKGRPRVNRSRRTITTSWIQELAIRAIIASGRAKDCSQAVEIATVAAARSLIKACGWENEEQYHALLKK